MAGPLVGSTNMQTLATNATMTPTEWDVPRFIDVLRESLKAVPLGQNAGMPGHQGSLARWHLFANTTAQTTARTEGVDPTNSVDLDESVITDSFQIFGAFFELTEEMDIATISGTRQQFIDGAAHQAALTLDTLTHTALSAAANTNNAGSGLKAEDLRKAALNLAAANAKPHPATPGGAFYCGLFSAEAAYDLIGEGAPTWYQAKAAAFEDNLTSPLKDTPASSAVHNVIVKMSTNVARNTATAPDDDENFVLADSAFGITSLETNVLQPKLMIVPSGVASLASPLGMRGTIGWKARFAAIILDDNRVREVLTDATGVG